MRVLISGGGSGGHVFPAIAIADAIKRKDPYAEFQFVGALGKMEMEKVPRAGYEIEGLWISGLQRKLSLRNLMLPFKVVSSLWKSRQIIKQFKPDVAVGVGGYASFAALTVAHWMKVPILLQEQNSYAGLTNRQLARKADRVCVAYDGMERFFKPETIVHTGNPVRKDIGVTDNKRTEAYQYYNFEPSKKTILIVGGSLGARTLNEAMDKSVEHLRRHEDVQVLWQCGSMYYERFKDSEAAGLPNVTLTQFIERMDLAYAMADVVISRAGAIAISELCMVGKPTVLVPSPNVAEDHQRQNALALVNREAALMVEDANADIKMLDEAIKILQREELAERLQRNIREMARPDATDRIAAEVIDLAKQKTT